MKIAHISDLHFSRSYKSNNIRKTKRLIKYCIEQGFDHLVITGDISDNSDEKDFLILRNILNNFNLLDSGKVSLTIGNHDIFGGVQTANDIVNFPSKCLKINYDQKVKKFVSFFSELFDSAVFPNPDKIFPYAKIIGDVAIIGINSIRHYSRIKNPFASNGKIYNDDFESIKAMLEFDSIKVRKKIVAVHHHFYKNSVEATSSQSNLWNRIEGYTLKLRGKKKLLKLFKENKVDLVLHGHSHELKEYERKGIKFVNAGASIDNTSSTEANVFFINILEDELTVQLKTLPEINPSVPKENEVPNFIPAFAEKIG
ncbi:MAG: metallophosphoesterase [Bacteroidetes bacterium]|nr:metallophosphoesterase [Bacteroidota bacterium]